MAIITANGLTSFGYITNRTSSAITNLSLANIGYAQGFQFFENAAITRFAVYTSTVTTNPSNAQIGLQTIDATTGLPSGTYLASVAANSYTANSWNVFTLSTPYNVSAGDKLYVVWFNNTGSTINISMNTQEQGALFKSNNPTYAAAKTTSAAAWAKSGIAFPCFCGTATQWFGESNVFGNIQYTPNFTDEVGFSITMPNNVPEMRLYAIETALGISNVTTADVSYKIYNSAGTLLQTFETYDNAISSTNTAVPNVTVLRGNATDLYFQPGTKYYIMMALSGSGTPSTYNLSKVVDIQNSSTGIVSKYTTKVGTTFTESATEYIPFRLIFDAARYDDSTGGGGGGFRNASFIFTGGFSG
jgi:hypothetical protein